MSGSNGIFAILAVLMLVLVGGYGIYEWQKPKYVSVDATATAAYGVQSQVVTAGGLSYTVEPNGTYLWNGHYFANLPVPNIPIIVTPSNKSTYGVNQLLNVSLPASSNLNYSDIAFFNSAGNSVPAWIQSFSNYAGTNRTLIGYGQNYNAAGFVLPFYNRMSNYVSNGGAQYPLYAFAGKHRGELIYVNTFMKLAWYNPISATYGNVTNGTITPLYQQTTGQTAQIDNAFQFDTPFDMAISYGNLSKTAGNVTVEGVNTTTGQIYLLTTHIPMVNDLQVDYVGNGKFVVFWDYSNGTEGDAYVGDFYNSTCWNTHVPVGLAANNIYWVWQLHSFVNTQGVRITQYDFTGTTLSEKATFLLPYPWVQNQSGANGMIYTPSHLLFQDANSTGFINVAIGLSNSLITSTGSYVYNTTDYLQIQRYSYSSGYVVATEGGKYGKTILLDPLNNSTISVANFSKIEAGVGGNNNYELYNPFNISTEVSFNTALVNGPSLSFPTSYVYLYNYSGMRPYKSALVWLKLPSAGTQAIQLAIFPSNIFTLNANGPIGEAPQLSSTYAEYDNGNLIFPMYYNFTHDVGIDYGTTAVSFGNGIAITGTTSTSIHTNATGISLTAYEYVSKLQTATPGAATSWGWLNQNTGWINSSVLRTDNMQYPLVSSVADSTTGNDWMVISNQYGVDYNETIDWAIGANIPGGKMGAAATAPMEAAQNITAGVTYKMSNDFLHNGFVEIKYNGNQVALFPNSGGYTFTVENGARYVITAGSKSNSPVTLTFNGLSNGRQYNITGFNSTTGTVFYSSTQNPVAGSINITYYPASMPLDPVFTVTELARGALPMSTVILMVGFMLFVAVVVFAITRRR